MTEEINSVSPGWSQSVLHTCHVPGRGCHIQAFTEPMPQKQTDYKPAEEPNHPKGEGSKRNMPWAQSTTEALPCLIHQCFLGKVGFELQTQDLEVPTTYSWEGRSGQVHMQRS